MASSATATVTLPTDDQILITREFDAPRELVWRAYTEPDLVLRLAALFHDVGKPPTFTISQEKDG